MILTRDNLLNFIRQNKYTIPMSVAESFDTTTMIASAALSDLAKEKLIGITHLKLSTSPYYYDLKQKNALVEIGEKHLSSYEKEVFLKLKEQKVLNDKSLSIQERLAVDRIKDFAQSLEIDNKGVEFKFWVWYLNDLNEVKKQILDALRENEAPKKVQKKVVEPVKKEVKVESKPQIKAEKTQINQSKRESDNTHNNKNVFSKFENVEESYEDKIDKFLNDFFKEHYLKIESKLKQEKGDFFSCSLSVNSIKVFFDCFYFYKKPTDAELIKFYVSSNNPKIVFIEKAPKKLEKLAENLENLTVINI